jgi:transcription elongation factor GreA
METKPPRRPGQEPTATLTPGAHKRLTEELERLTTTGRAEIAERLERAREHGDIRENAEYDAAKDAQGLMEARIREIQRLLRDPEIVDGPAALDAASPGVLVVVRPVDDEDDEEERFLLAASKEERAAGARTVSISSPLGEALLDKRVGDHVTYEAPGGTFTYEIVGLEIPT